MYQLSTSSLRSSPTKQETKQNKRKINPYYFYRDDIITLLWEKAVKKSCANSQYFLADGRIVSTLFENTTQIRRAGLLLNRAGRPLFLENMRNHAIIIAQGLAEHSSTPSLEPVIGSLDDGLEIINNWQTIPKNHRLLSDLSILFPLRRGRCHWNFAILELTLNRREILMADLYLYEPFAQSSSIPKEFLSNIKEILKKRLDLSDHLSIGLRLIPCGRQHYLDGAACGAIVAQDGMNLLNGPGLPTCSFLPYPVGALNLRQTHIDMIADESFTKEQWNNQFYRLPQKDPAPIPMERVCKKIREAFETSPTARSKLTLLATQVLSSEDEKQSHYYQQLRAFLVQHQQAFGDYFHLFLKDKEHWTSNGFDLIHSFLAGWHAKYRSIDDPEPISENQPLKEEIINFPIVDTKEEKVINEQSLVSTSGQSSNHQNKKKKEQEIKKETPPSPTTDVSSHLKRPKKTSPSTQLKLFLDAVNIQNVHKINFQELLNQLDKDLDKDIVSLIKETNQKEKIQSSNIFLVIKNDYLKVLKYLHHKGANINVTNIHQETALHQAVYWHQFKAMQFLCSKGANIEATNLNKKTALHLAVSADNFKAVQFLCSKGANIEATNLNKETTLHVAVSRYNFRVAKFLWSKGANIEATEKFGRTVLMLAIERPCFEIVEFLVSKGANIEATNLNKETALHLAASVGNFEAVQFLWSKDANIEATEKFGRTVLMSAIERPCFEIVEFLVSKGANIEATEKWGNRALILAVKKQDLRIVEFLVSKGAHLDVINNAGRNALLEAGYNGYDSIILSLAVKMHESTKADQPLSHNNIFSIRNNISKQAIALSLDREQEQKFLQLLIKAYEIIFSEKIKISIKNDIQSIKLSEYRSPPSREKENKGLKELISTISPFQWGVSDSSISLKIKHATRKYCNLLTNSCLASLVVNQMDFVNRINNSSRRYQIYDAILEYLEVLGIALEIGNLFPLVRLEKDIIDNQIAHEKTIIVCMKNLLYVQANILIYLKKWVNPKNNPKPNANDIKNNSKIMRHYLKHVKYALTLSKLVQSMLENNRALCFYLEVEREKCQDTYPRFSLEYMEAKRCLDYAMLLLYKTDQEKDGRLFIEAISNLIYLKNKAFPFPNFREYLQKYNQFAQKKDKKKLCAYLSRSITEIEDVKKAVTTGPKSQIDFMIELHYVLLCITSYTSFKSIENIDDLFQDIHHINSKSLNDYYLPHFRQAEKLFLKTRASIAKIFKSQPSTVSFYNIGLSNLLQLVNKTIVDIEKKKKEKEEAREAFIELMGQHKKQKRRNSKQSKQKNRGRGKHQKKERENRRNQKGKKPLSGIKKGKKKSSSSTQHLDQPKRKKREDSSTTPANHQRKEKRPKKALVDQKKKSHSTKSDAKKDHSSSPHLSSTKRKSVKTKNGDKLGKKRKEQTIPKDHQNNRTKKIASSTDKNINNPLQIDLHEEASNHTLLSNNHPIQSSKSKEKGEKPLSIVKKSKKKIVKSTKKSEKKKKKDSSTTQKTTTPTNHQRKEKRPKKALVDQKKKSHSTQSDPKKDHSSSPHLSSTKRKSVKTKNGDKLGKKRRRRGKKKKESNISKQVERIETPTQLPTLSQREASNRPPTLFCRKSRGSCNTPPILSRFKKDSIQEEKRREVKTESLPKPIQADSMSDQKDELVIAKQKLTSDHNQMPIDNREISRNESTNIDFVSHSSVSSSLNLSQQVLSRTRALVEKDQPQQQSKREENLFHHALCLRRSSSDVFPSLHQGTSTPSTQRKNRATFTEQNQEPCIMPPPPGFEDTASLSSLIVPSQTNLDSGHYRPFAIQKEDSKQKYPFCTPQTDLNLSLSSNTHANLNPSIVQLSQLSFPPKSTTKVTAEKKKRKSKKEKVDTLRSSLKDRKTKPYYCTLQTVYEHDEHDEHDQLYGVTCKNQNLFISEHRLIIDQPTPTLTELVNAIKTFLSHLPPLFYHFNHFKMIDLSRALNDLFVTITEQASSFSIASLGSQNIIPYFSSQQANTQYQKNEDHDIECYIVTNESNNARIFSSLSHFADRYQLHKRKLLKFDPSKDNKYPHSLRNANIFRINGQFMDQQLDLSVLIFQNKQEMVNSMLKSFVFTLNSAMYTFGRHEKSYRLSIVYHLKLVPLMMGKKRIKLPIAPTKNIKEFTVLDWAFMFKILLRVGVIQFPNLEIIDTDYAWVSDEFKQAVKEVLSPKNREFCFHILIRMYNRQNYQYNKELFIPFTVHLLQHLFSPAPKGQFNAHGDLSLSSEFFSNIGRLALTEIIHYTFYGYQQYGEAKNLLLYVDTNPLPGRDESHKHKRDAFDLRIYFESLENRDCSSSALPNSFIERTLREDPYLRLLQSQQPFYRSSNTSQQHHTIYSQSYNILPRISGTGDRLLPLHANSYSLLNSQIPAPPAAHPAAQPYLSPGNQHTNRP